MLFNTTTQWVPWEEYDTRGSPRKNVTSDGSHRKYVIPDGSQGKNMTPDVSHGKNVTPGSYFSHDPKVYDISSINQGTLFLIMKLGIIWA